MCSCRLNEIKLHIYISYLHVIFKDLILLFVAEYRCYGNRGWDVRSTLEIIQIRQNTSALISKAIVGRDL